MYKYENNLYKNYHFDINSQPVDFEIMAISYPFKRNDRREFVFLSKYVKEEERLRTFSELPWSQSASKSPEALARAGFFNVGILDCVECAFCHLRFLIWDNIEGDPLLHHATAANGRCRFIKGHYVANVPIGIDPCRASVANPTLSAIADMGPQGEIMEYESNSVMFWTPDSNRPNRYGNEVAHIIEMVLNYNDTNRLLSLTQRESQIFGMISLDKPYRRAFSDYSLRLGSFTIRTSWAWGAVFSSETCVLEGFYRKLFPRSQSVITCFCCGVTYDVIKSLGDRSRNLSEIHKAISPKCPIVQLKQLADNEDNDGDDQIQNSEARCVVCLSKKRSVLYVPCRHYVACAGCALMTYLNATYQTSTNCVYCKKNFVGIIPTFNV